ncbi:MULTISPECIES: hypothetical protein [Photorhabdus]|uniref:MFS transporter n=1 Tax=Photorhabdus aegyptia TaxID=2805098 RepID=A0A022PDR7_9GAMM|nr:MULTISPECIES: hypothetical protein [Photorhabdus]KGM27769.1 hypothetical protein KS18_12850 [Photorhabdus luminescens]EYU13689.1 hypothetical protein BA1DRAFT_03814 [Photorhabdus aegyptia]MBS9427541.1 hypothetical protein [Photorhabdus akhurstii]MCC8457963.1 hypothetical protein [Photorhabdus aegyptia]PQQ25435.1 hypothetical protein C6H69_22440 [Photorhabdus luminescens]
MVLLTIARADAMYSSVAMSVTILELALIATNEHLGNFSLEFTLISQLVISLIIEFASGSMMSFNFGLARTTVIGFWLKLLSAFLLLAGFALSYIGYFYLAWFIIIMSFVCDAAGTGCLKTTFRPSYNMMSIFKIGEPADYVNSFKYYLYIRLILPFILLGITIVLIGFFNEKVAAIAIFSMIMILRLIQIFQSKKDLDCIHKEKNNNNVLGFYKLKDFLSVVKLNVPNSLLFITGNIFESIVLMYSIGLLYKYQVYLNLPNYLAWLGSSSVAFVIYLFSAVMGNQIMVRLKRFETSIKLKQSLVLVSLLASTLLLISPLGASQFITLSFFSLIGVSVGLIMTRIAINTALYEFDERKSVVFFLFVETMTTGFIILFSIAGSLFFKEDSVIKAFCVGLIVFLLSYFIYTFFVKLPSSYEKDS